MYKNGVLIDSNCPPFWHQEVALMNIRRHNKILITMYKI